MTPARIYGGCDVPFVRAWRAAERRSCSVFFDGERHEPVEASEKKSKLSHMYSGTSYPSSRIVRRHLGSATVPLMVPLRSTLSALYVTLVQIG